MCQILCRIRDRKLSMQEEGDGGGGGGAGGVLGGA